MKLQITVFAAILLASATSAATARAPDRQTQNLIKAYNASQYASAAELGEKLVAKRPSDYTARYYLANTYVFLHKNEQAIGQYRMCLNSGLQGPLKQYSSTALERLLKQKEQTLMAAQGEKPEEKEIKAFQKKLRQEAKTEQDRLRQEWNKALVTANNNRRGRSFGYNRYGGGGYGYGRINPYDDETYRINDYYSKKMADLTNYEDSMLSQANCGKSRIRLQPSLSSSKVKNYIHYGDDSEAEEIPVDNPLHAQARSLGDTAPAKPTAANGHKPGTTGGHTRKTGTAASLSRPGQTAKHQTQPAHPSAGAGGSPVSK
jgi:hypothetical protein